MIESRLGSPREVNDQKTHNIGHLRFVAIACTLIACWKSSLVIYCSCDPSRPSISSLMPFCPSSGMTLTSTSSRILYPRCLFIHPSSHISNSVSTSLIHTVSSPPKSRLHMTGGIRETMASAHWCLIWVISAGVGGGWEGGGRLFWGNIVCRARRRICGRS